MHGTSAKTKDFASHDSRTLDADDPFEGSEGSLVNNEGCMEYDPPGASVHLGTL